MAIIGCIIPLQIELGKFSLSSNSLNLEAIVREDAVIALGDAELEENEADELLDSLFAAKRRIPLEFGDTNE